MRKCYTVITGGHTLSNMHPEPYTAPCLPSSNSLGHQKTRSPPHRPSFPILQLQPHRQHLFLSAQVSPMPHSISGIPSSIRKSSRKKPQPKIRTSILRKATVETYWALLRSKAEWELSWDKNGNQRGTSPTRRRRNVTNVRLCLQIPGIA